MYPLWYYGPVGFMYIITHKVLYSVNVKELKLDYKIARVTKVFLSDCEHPALR